MEYQLKQNTYKMLDQLSLQAQYFHILIFFKQTNKKKKKGKRGRKFHFVNSKNIYQWLSIQLKKKILPEETSIFQRKVENPCLTNLNHPVQHSGHTKGNFEQTYNLLRIIRIYSSYLFIFL